MTVFQSQSNGYCAYKVQSALGSQASASDAKIFRTTGGSPGTLTKASTESGEVRRDGMSSRGRHGIQKTQGSPSGQLALGAYDDVFEALLRDTYANSLVLDYTDFTSLTTGTHTIILATGSPITLGLRVHDVIRLTNHSQAGNNGRNLRISALNATTITVVELLTAEAGADTTVEITRPGRKLIQYTNGLVKRYFTWEENEIDIDGSELFTDSVFGNGKWTMTPNGIIMFDAGWWGTGQFETKTGASAPFFTSPAENTGTPMAVVDATIRLGSEDLVELTSFDLTFDISPVAPDVFGSGAIKYSPDVFTGPSKVSMNLTALRKDLAYVANFVAEDQLSLHVLAVDNEAEPKDFISLVVPNFTLGSVNKSALANTGGPRTQTIAIPNALTGKDERGGAYDATQLKIQISNAS